MKKIILAVIFLCSYQSIYSQTGFNPEDWYGEWKGKLEILKTGVPEFQNVDMELHISKTTSKDTLNFTIIYKSSTINQERKYKLIALDAERGLFKLDENNGIILDMNYFGTGLYSTFEVQGILITSAYVLSEGVIHFSVISSNYQSPNESKSKEDNMIVNSFPVYALQKSILKK